MFGFLEELKNLRAGGEGGGQGEDVHKWNINYGSCRAVMTSVSYFQADFCGPALWVVCLQMSFSLHIVPFFPQVPFTTLYTGVHCICFPGYCKALTSDYFSCKS